MPKLNIRSLQAVLAVSAALTLLWTGGGFDGGLGEINWKAAKTGPDGPRILCWIMTTESVGDGAGAVG